MLVVSVLCVATTYRGRGVATRLVRDLLRTATSSDCQAAAVIVSSQHSERFVMMNELGTQSILNDKAYIFQDIFKGNKSSINFIFIQTDFLFV